MFRGEGDGRGVHKLLLSSMYIILCVCVCVYLFIYSFLFVLVWRGRLLPETERKK